MGGRSTVYAERIDSKNIVSTSDLLKILEERDYLDLNVIKRDGRIVRYKAEDTYKI